MTTIVAVLLGLALSVSWLLPGLACGGDPPGFTVGVKNGKLVVTPLVPYDHLSLRVAGPDGQVVQVDGDGGPVSFGLPAVLRPGAADGSYTWEVRFTARGAVDPELLARTRRARESGDLQPEQTLRWALPQAILVRSGALLVVDGQLVMDDRVEPRSGPHRRPARTGLRGAFELAALTEDEELVPVDQVISDDLIVQSSLCVGFDCVNNESFGFDTVRLKENNLRIKFEDTSVVAGFPSNDWQLTANDSVSGGANRFSIEDVTGGRIPFTIRAGAPTSSLVVDPVGRVGLRTAIPVLDLHAATGNTPGIRLDQTAAAGFSAQVWDVAGNEANFFVRDVTGGSRLPFRIRPGAPTSSLDIAASGNVGIGTSSPGAKLHVFGAETTDVFATMGLNAAVGPAFNFGYAGASFGRSVGFVNVRPDAGAVAPNPSLRFLTADVERMIIDNEGFVGLGVANPAHPIHLASGARVTAGGVWTDASSREVKQDIVPLTAEEARTAFEALRPVRFAYRVAPEERHVGFVAEDVPGLVASADRKGLSPMDLVAVLTRVLQEQRTVVEAQQRVIADLARRVAELEQSRRP